MISVIVPVLNEARILPAALGDLLEQEGRFEVIVVDGGSTDGSYEVARQTAGVRRFFSEKGRGARMNAGAAAARGEYFLFLHVDTRLPPGAILALQAAAKSGLQAGAFRHSFAAADWRLRLISAGHNLQCRLTRIYYGDHAIFARRDVFERVRGFPEVALLEDVIFCQRLRTVVHAALLPQVVETDARRFLQHGVWRTTGRALFVLARHAFGLTPGDRRSWDEVRRAGHSPFRCVRGQADGDSLLRNRAAGGAVDMIPHGQSAGEVRNRHDGGGCRPDGQIAHKPWLLRLDAIAQRSPALEPQQRQECPHQGGTGQGRRAMSHV